VAPGASALTIAAAVTRIALKAFPDDVVDGARVVSLGTVHVPTEPNGTITDPAGLARIAATAEFRAFASSKGVVPLRGVWRLARALDVVAVPPGSIVGLEAGTPCILSDTSPVQVRLISSLAGRALVSFPQGPPPQKIQVQPGTDARCS
jgi:hypothetical protein